MKKYKVTLVVDTPYPPKKEDVEFYMASDDATVLSYIVEEMVTYGASTVIINDMELDKEYNIVSRETLGRKKGPRRRGQKI